MRMIEREDLRRGFVIAYTVPDSAVILHGEILHLGLGFASRHAVWIRCLDGYSQSRVECIRLEQVRGVISYAS